MFGHFPELIIILVVALIVFGPEKLPEVAATAGKMMGELRRAMDVTLHPEEPKVPDDFSTYYYEAMARNGEEPYEEDGELRFSSYVEIEEPTDELGAPEEAVGTAGAAEPTPTPLVAPTSGPGDAAVSAPVDGLEALHPAREAVDEH